MIILEKSLDSFGTFSRQAISSMPAHKIKYGKKQRHQDSSQCRLLHTLFFPSSDQVEMPEGIHDSLFLLMWACKHLSFTGSNVIVLPLLKPSLVLDLSDVKARNIQTVLFLNIILYLMISSSPWLALQFLDIKINVDMSVNFFPT